MKKRTLPLLFSLMLSFAISGNAQLKKTASPKDRIIGCGTVDPVKNFSMDTTHPRGMADNYYLWDNGKTLYVKFMNPGYSVYKAYVKKYAKEWEQYANIHLEFVESGDAQIRVALGDDKEGYGHVTMGVGTLALSRAADDFTIHFDTTHLVTISSLHSTVVHEFGHALGLEHEHQYPASGIKWNKEKVYADFAKKPNEWNRAMVDAQIFGNYSMMHTNGTKYDPKSIMHYPLDASQTLDGFSVGWNTSISDGDKQLMEILYPKNGERLNEVSRFSVSNFTSLQVEKNTERQGLSFYPSFNITASGKQGEILMVIFLNDKNDNPILVPTDTKKVVCVYRDFLFPVNKPILMNKGQKTCEFFMPYSVMPMVAGNNEFIVKFKIMQFADNEWKTIFYYKPVQVSIAK